LAGGATVPARAADEPKAPPALERKALDEIVRKALYDVINQGADLYNPPINNHEGCYRLYEGSLMTLRPLLEHHPELQKVIATALADAPRAPSPAERAFVLRRAMDRVRADLNPNKPAGKTLWDRLGGKENVTRVVDDFVAAAAKDPKVNFDRNGKYKLTPEAVTKLKASLVELISDVSGGPLKYSGGDMKTVHKGMGITNEEFNALGMHLLEALKKNGAAPDDIKAVMDVVESTRKDIVEKKEEVGGGKPLWERLGGEANVAKVVDDFVNTAAKDRAVNFDRNGKFKLDKEDVAKLKEHLVALISEISGGPLKYKGRSMKEVHKGMGITDEEFDATARDLVMALKRGGAAADDIKELMDKVETTRKDIVEKTKGDDKKEQATVSGKVTIAGKPLAGGTITFTTEGSTATADVQADGTYSITVKSGTYKIGIKGKAKEIVPVAYSDPDKSGLTLEVKGGVNNANLELK
jgi:truncated hemoglobin YjbI